MRNWFPGTQTLRSSLDIPLHLQSSLIPSWVLWLAPVVVLLVGMNANERLDLWLRGPNLQFHDVFPIHLLVSIPEPLGRLAIVIMNQSCRYST